MIESDKTDEEVVNLVVKNSDYFAILLKRYEVKIFNYISRISNFSEQQKEDILQDIFVKAYLNINSFNTDLKFSSWLYRIAHNEVINNFKKSKRRPEIVRIDPDNDFLERLKSGLDLEKEIDLKLKKENLIKAINEVGEKYKEILILRFIEEKDYKEISDILKIPMGTVATLVKRGKNKLKDKIKKYE